jgi:hypothetical protein
MDAQHTTQHESGPQFFGEPDDSKKFFVQKYQEMTNTGNVTEESKLHINTCLFCFGGGQLFKSLHLEAICQL